MKKKDWVEVATGAALIVGSIVDIIPGDEVAAVPTGMYLILDGMHWI